LTEKPNLRPWGKFTYKELAERMREAPKNSHHRLPGGRGNKKSVNNKRNLIDINMHRHMLWHVLVYDKIGTEVAAQMATWWKQKFIFEEYRVERCVCDHKITGTKWIWSKRRIDSKMSQSQRLAWGELFGHKTHPDIVFKIINEFLVHPDTPIQCTFKRHRGR